MTSPRVYIETSIPSFYFETRSTPEMVARRQWTRRWWDETNERYELVTSPAVLEELKRTDFPGQEECLRLMAGVSLLRMEPVVTEIVETYIRHYVMPNDPVGDALHPALASFHKCDFLVTWNCRHLANANNLVTSEQSMQCWGYLFPRSLHHSSF